MVKNTISRMFFHICAWFYAVMHTKV